MKLSKSLLVVLILLVVILAAAAVVFQGRTGGKPEIARLTILSTGDVDGYLLNCGCSGGQLGGEIRKARLINNERADAAKGTPADRGLPAEVVVVDSGNFIDGHQPISMLYSEGIVRSMALQGYDSVGIGINELTYAGQRDRGNVQRNLWELLGGLGLPLTAANLRFVSPQDGEDRSSALNALYKPYRVIRTAGGYRVGIVHVVDTRLSETERKVVGVELEPMDSSAQAILDQHRREADFWILTVGGAELYKDPPAEIAKLDGFTLVIGYDKPNPLEPENSKEVVYPYFISRPFPKAKSVVRSKVHFGEDSQLRILSEHLLLNSNINPDENVEKIIAELQPQLEKLEIDETEERLKSRGPKPWYVGKETCRQCHTEIYDFMEGSHHARAWQDLVDVGKEKNADCVSCHVTGHGTNIGGWNILNNNVPQFQNVTCESCHGPGEYHFSAMESVMMGGDWELPDDFSSNGRNALGIYMPDQRDCRKCHDPINSVNFNFKEYWARIDHTAEGMPAALELREQEQAAGGDSGSDHGGHGH